VSLVGDLFIREATFADLPMMASLLRKGAMAEREGRLRDRFVKNPHGWYVALQKKEVAGFCQLVVPRVGDGWLQWLRLNQRIEGEEVGGALIDHMERMARGRGVKLLRIGTQSTHDPVHRRMGGMRGYTQGVRWTRMTRLQQEPARALVNLRRVEEVDHPASVLGWLRERVGYAASGAGVTSLGDLKQIVTLEEAFLTELFRHRGRSGIVAASQGGEIEAMALYAVCGGELRVLQVIAETTLGGLAATAGAVATARPRELVTFQVAGATPDLLTELHDKYAGKRSVRQDFYVFSKDLTAERDDSNL
jgi:N-acetylglutamate synthase-like GNAT family acetyltransferase